MQNKSFKTTPSLSAKTPGLKGELVSPGLAGHQDVGVYVGAGLGHLQVEPGTDGQ